MSFIRPALAAIIAAQIALPHAALAEDESWHWYAIDQHTSDCVRATPGEILQDARDARRLYTTHDERDGAGRLTQTTISFPEFDSQITFYRGLDRCNEARNNGDAAATQESERYR